MIYVAGFCSLVDKRGVVTYQYEVDYGIEPHHDQYGSVVATQQPVSEILG